MYTHFNRLLLRTPLNPLNRIVETPPINEDYFKEGIFLASPELLQELEKLKNKTIKEKEKLNLSLLKYWIRSCMRCTPYGTFAACGIVEIKNSGTNIILNPRDKFVKKARIDMNYISSLVATLNGTELIDKGINLFTNNSLYSVNSQYRYADYFIKNNTRIYNLAAAPKTDYLELIINRANDGATIEELCNLLLERTNGFSKIEIKEFILELLSSQILISELEPSITGIEPLQQLIKILETKEKDSSLLISLQNIKSLLDRTDLSLQSYTDIEEHLSFLKGKVETPKNITQVDQYLSLDENVINEKLIDKIISQSAELFLLSKPYKSSDLEAFKKKFIERYENEKVSLSLALDPDIGIGYSTITGTSTFTDDFIDDLNLAFDFDNNQIEFNYIQKYALKKYSEYLKLGKPYIEVLPEEIAGFKKNTEGFNFQESMAIMGSLYLPKDSSDEDFSFDLISVGGSSGANLLGRFAHGSTQIVNLIHDIVKAEDEAHPDSILGEIVHMPQARIGNILLRPIIRNYEIPYISKSGLENKKMKYV